MGQRLERWVSVRESVGWWAIVWDASNGNQTTSEEFLIRRLSSGSIEKACALFRNPLRKTANFHHNGPTSRKSWDCSVFYPRRRCQDSWNRLRFVLICWWFIVKWPARFCDWSSGTRHLSSKPANCYQRQNVKQKLNGRRIVTFRYDPLLPGGYEINQYECLHSLSSMDYTILLPRPVYQKES